MTTEEGVTVAQAQFAKQLASNDKEERYAAVEGLKTFLAKKKTMTEMELLKIWKGLFYCMWMSDKPIVQRELGDNLSALIHFVKANEVPLFVKTYFDTMIREWGSVDHLRMDKYYYFMRAFLRNTLEYLYNHKYPKKTMNALKDGLKSIWNEDGSSYEVILHLCDIWATEIFRACGSVAPNELLLTMLEVFIHFYKYADHTAIEKRVQSRVFSTLFDAHFPDKPSIVPDLAKDKETYPDIYFSNLDLDSVAALLLKHASDKEEFFHRNGLYRARTLCLTKQHSTVADLPTKRTRHSKTEAASYQKRQNEDFLDSMADYYMERRAADRQQREEEEGIDHGDEEEANGGEDGDEEEVNGGDAAMEEQEEEQEEKQTTARSKQTKKKGPKKSADGIEQPEVNMEDAPAVNGSSTEAAKSKKKNRRRKTNKAAISTDTTTNESAEETKTADAPDRKRKRNTNNIDNTNGAGTAKQPLEEIEAKVADVPLDEVALNHTPGHHASFSHDMHKHSSLTAESTSDSSSNGRKKQGKTKSAKSAATTTETQPGTPKGKQEDENISSPPAARKSVRWAKNQVKEFSSEVTPTTPKSAPTQSKLKGLLTRKDSPAPRRPSSSRKNVIQSGL